MSSGRSKKKCWILDYIKETWYYRGDYDDHDDERDEADKDVDNEDDSDGDDDKDDESDLSDDDDEDDNDCGKSRAGAENKTSECF